MKRLTGNVFNMQELNELSEADIKHDRCPICHYTEMTRYNGYKICKRCNAVYKLFDGKAYLVQ